jgi:hypothetical protein
MTPTSNFIKNFGRVYGIHENVHLGLYANQAFIWNNMAKKTELTDKF